MKKDQEIKFIVKIEKSGGITGTGKKSVYSHTTNKREMTQKQAAAYLKRTYGAMAFVGSSTRPTLSVFPTKDRKFAIETWAEGKKKPTIRLKNDFEEVISYIQTKIKDEKITIKIEKLVAYPTEWARKYKYKTDTRE